MDDWEEWIYNNYFGDYGPAVDPNVVAMANPSQMESISLWDYFDWTPETQIGYVDESGGLGFDQWLDEFFGNTSNDISYDPFEGIENIGLESGVPSLPQQDKGILDKALDWLKGIQWSGGSTGGSTGGSSQQSTPQTSTTKNSLMDLLAGLTGTKNNSTNILFIIVLIVIVVMLVIIAKK